MSKSRSETNKASYAKAKQRQDAALLRLDKGDLARLDAARGAVGLSRSAFAKLYLLPAAEALAARFVQIEEARAAARLSLETFLSRAIEAQLVAPAGEPAPIADEFDALFSSEEGPC